MEMEEEVVVPEIVRDVEDMEKEFTKFLEMIYN